MCLITANTIGWCVECKHSVKSGANHVFKNGMYYHLFCYLQKLGITLPLKFEDETFDPED